MSSSQCMMVGRHHNIDVSDRVCKLCNLREVEDEYHFLLICYIDWEARMDNYGRIFYIDHKNHTTTWKKPSVGSTPTLESTSNQILNTNDNQNGKIKHQQERQQLDRRYQCIRKSIARNASLFFCHVAYESK